MFVDNSRLLSGLAQANPVNDALSQIGGQVKTLFWILLAIGIIMLIWMFVFQTR